MYRHRKRKYWMILPFLIFFMASLPICTTAKTFTFSGEELVWQKLKGKALDVGISPEGKAYVISSSGRVWLWGSVLGEEWKLIPGHDFNRIDVSSSGKPWAINREGVIHFYNGLWWEKHGEGFVDVGAGLQGVVYALKGDGEVVKWNKAKREFEHQSIINAVRIDVDTKGVPWVVDEAGQLLYFRENSWKVFSTKVKDISIGPRGSIVAAMKNGTLQIWNPKQGSFEQAKSIKAALATSVGPQGKPWVVTEKGDIYASSLFVSERVEEPSQVSGSLAVNIKNESALEKRKRTAAGADASERTDRSRIVFREVSGIAQDIAIGKDGSVFIVVPGGDKLGKYSNTRKKFLDFPGQLSRITVSDQGIPWGVNSRKEVFHHNGKDWIYIRGVEGIDIATGGGEVYITDEDEKLFVFDPEVRRFKRFLLGKGRRIAVDPKGNPWTLDSFGKISRCNQKACTRIPGNGFDIAIGPDGSVYIVDTEGKLKLYDKKRNRFVLISGIKFFARAVDAGPFGRPWVVDINGQVYSSRFFDRDESNDIQLSARTKNLTTTVKDSIFTFTKSISFVETDVTSFGGESFLDIAVGADGTVTLLESPPFDPNNQRVGKFNSRNNKFETEVGSTIEFSDVIAVDPDGEYWIINGTTGNAYEQVGSRFIKRRGLVAGGTSTPDIAIGGEGSVFATDTNGKLYKYDSGVKKFIKFIRTGIYNRVAVDPLGVPWVIDDSNIIYKFTGAGFEKRPVRGTQLAQDIAIGADGSLYIAESTSGALKRWNTTNETFDNITNGNASRLAVSPDGRPWFIDLATPNKVFRPKD